MKRRGYIDITKGLGIIFVVLFHANVFSYIWTIFHMPLFAFSSGVLYSKKNHKTFSNLALWCEKKFRGCYFPFVMYEFIFLALHNFFISINILSPMFGDKVLKIKELLQQAINILLLGGGERLVGPLWYLIAMLEFTIIYAILLSIISIMIYLLDS